ncbi:MAG TPA: BTAD domain-containing putative transcriptional regulator [Gemmatimonadaceae bacterium]|jgi:serine/threonine-protein kinase
MLQLNTFGGLTLRMGDAQLTGPPTQRRRLALLALLAVAGDRGMSREKLLALLWPESDEPKARHALNQILFAQKRHFDDAQLFEGRKTLRLNPSQITSDVRVFEAAIGRGAPEEAADVYAGPFLDGFFLSNSNEFEQWATDQRERYANLCAGAVEAAAKRAADAGDFAAEVKWNRRAVELDPLAARRVMKLAESLAVSGDRSGAIRALRSYQDRIRKELGVSGDPDIERRIASFSADMGR